MTESRTESSVGIVIPQRFRHPSTFELQCGEHLAGFELVYETYGTLNAERSNAVLVCHALSGNHHAAGYHSGEERKPGWWDSCIGPGKPIDTDRFFVLSLNNLGGCDGSTGPLSIDPATGRAFGPDFPGVTVKDWVASQALLADHLGITQFAAVIGGSLGGMQAMQWAMDYPRRLRCAVLIASAARLSAQNIAFNEIARKAIQSDPRFHGGHYREKGTNPDLGLMLARMVGHVTYLSDDGMRMKFGREIKSGDIRNGRDVQFQVESYLHYQGRSFSQRFDANTYLLMTHALDYFDPAGDFEDNLVAALQNVQCRFCVIAFSSDWRFSAERSKEIVDALIAAGKDVSSAVIQSEHGHDSFLLPIPRYFDVLGGYFDRLATEIEHAS
ncbi:MAG: homoserine O-acetyltransferase [Pseudomonadales bacterium]|nr:homoserine O-acetyltransferase [Pseudomonadales bacterium]